MKRHLIPFTALLCACPIGNDKFTKPGDLSPEWLVDRARILAIRANPPEVLPTEAATFEALIVGTDPEDPPVTVWIACPPEDDGGIGFGCGLDAEADFSNLDPTSLDKLGVIGFEPGFAPRYGAPADLLDGVEDPLEGVYVLVQAAVLPSSVLSADDDAAFDFNEVEVAYKRLRVSSSTSPNANPELDGYQLDGITLPPQGGPVLLDGGEIYRLGAIYGTGAVEVYAYINPQGETEDRVEEPYLRWYTDGGELLQDATLYPNAEVDWIAPEESGASGTWWTVIRDRRGGISWIEQTWQVR